MAEKADKKEEKAGAGAAPAEGKKAGGIGGLLKSTPALLGVVMVLEAGVLFAGFKMLSGPKPAHGAELITEETPASDGPGAAAKKELIEMQVVSFKAPNQKRGRSYLYDVGIYIAVKTEFKDRVEAALRSREASIQDRVRTIIAQSDPEKLGGGAEPGLETLRRQVKFQLDEVLGEGLIEEVLIPRCIPYRAEF
jgi:flagellar basal body-associated protein FliL